MIIAVGILVGLLSGWMSGGSFRSMASVHLQAEPFLWLLAGLQLALPWLHPAGAGTTIAYWIWLLSFPLFVAVALANARRPGLGLVAIGLALNFAVVFLNHGMPIDPAAAENLRHLGASPIKALDWAHRVSSAYTILPHLGDVMPLRGPMGLRFILSVGDTVMAAGIVSFVAGSMLTRPSGARLVKP